MPETWAGVVEQLADSAFRYGPFFFSIWFLYAIARWSYRNYASLHAGGRATLEELKNHWRYFVAVTVFGCMLVVVSSYWWLGVHSRPATYVFQGEIMGIDKDDKLSSSELYIRAISYDDSDEKIISFVAVELQPFESNRVFIINMTRHSSKVAKKPMRIKYDDCPVHRYYLVGDDLVPIGNGSSQKDCKLSSLGRV